MSAKISGLPTESAIDPASELTYVAGGVNYKGTLAKMLLAEGGMSKAIHDALGNGILVNDATNQTTITVAASSQFVLESGGMQVMVVNGAGDVGFNTGASHDISFSAGSNGITMGHLAPMALTCFPGQSVSVQYGTAAPMAWMGPAPTTLHDAINRIANHIATSIIGPIP